MSCTTTNNRQEYRCCIAAENSAGQLKIAGKTFPVCVLNTSRTGFRVRVPNAIAKRLRGKKLPVLTFAGETWEVEVKSRYTDDSKFTDLGFARRRDLTKYKEPSSWSLALLPQWSVSNDPAFLGMLVIALLTAVVCLPGIGDSLGTAPKVRTVIQSVLKSN